MKKGRFSSSQKNGRLNLIIAILFLLGGLILLKLFILQVKQHDYYKTLGDGQHQISSVLKPKRGEIYFNDNTPQGSSILYPFATNKEFASVFAIPKDIKNVDFVADVLYQVFKQKSIEEEVLKLLNKEEIDKQNEELKYVDGLVLSEQEKNSKKEEITKRHEDKKKDSDYLEYKEIKKQAEIEARKKIVIEDYLTNLRKKDDPYEPISKKVEENDLLKLYALLVSNSQSLVEAEDLVLKNGKVLKLANENEEIIPDGISFNMVEYRYYPEKNIGSNILGFVNIIDDQARGNYGIEGFFNKELFGKYGSIKSEKGANDNVVIVNDREYSSPVNGDGVVLTIDRTIELNVCNIFNRGIMNHGADGGSLIIIKPSTGEIVAMCSYPDFDPNNYEQVSDISVYNNPAIFNQYEPGSIFKPITMAASLNEGAVTPETKYTDEGRIMIPGWPKPISNSDFSTFGGHGEVTMNTVLEQSLNTGVIFAMKKIGPEKFSSYIQNFGFGEKTGIELEGEAKGDINNLLVKNIKQIDAAVASFGQGLTCTPLQMVASYAAIANGGELMKPYIVKEIIKADGTKETTKPRLVRQVVSRKTANILSAMLVNVVEKGHGQKAGVKGYYVAGKTGTAQIPRKDGKGYIAGANIGSFAGFAPVNNPAFAMLVRVDRPRDVAWAESSAAPIFGEVAEFLMQYWQIPKERNETENKK